MLAELAACDGGTSLSLLAHLAQASPADTALLADQLVGASVACAGTDAHGLHRTTLP